MNQRNFCHKLLACFFLFAVVALAPSTLFGWQAISSKTTSNLADKKPNIVLIMVDDLGAADLGCYGSKAIKTPNIDRLAGQGMKFSNAYAGHTVCAPSRCVLMTGLHTGHARIRGNNGSAPIKDTDVTVAELLQKAGYKTGGFGKWGLGTMGTAGAAEKQGFDEFFGYYHQVHAHTYFPPFLVKNGKPYVLKTNAAVAGITKDEILSKKKWNYQRFKRKDPKGTPTKMKTALGTREYTHYVIFDQMKKFINENKDQPFFCYAPWTPPHAKYQIPEDEPAWILYRNKPWSTRAKVHAAFISMLDRHVGEVSKQLEELGIAENTMVIFMSDNGASGRFEGELDSSGNLRGYKRNLYEGGIRTPLIVRWPGNVKPGSTSNINTYSADFFPTFCELAGVSIPKSLPIDGLSILPTLTGKGKQKTHRCLYWQSTIRKKEKEAVRMGDLKFVRNASNKWEVYNLAKDPSESNNVVETHQKELKEVLDWIKENTTPQ